MPISCLLVTLPVTVPIALPVILPVALPVILPVALPVLLPTQAALMLDSGRFNYEVLHGKANVCYLSPFGAPSQLSVD